MDLTVSDVPGGDVGHFSYIAATNSWWWSDGMYALYGYDPAGDVKLSPELVKQHKHPEDAERANRAREEALRTGGVYSCYHRIIDRAGRVRSVHTVARSATSDTGGVVRLDGFCVDLTMVRRAETEVEVQAALAGMVEHRAVIDQAKGMIMVATGCTGDEAFECLSRYSQNANIKLSAIARRIVDAVESERGGTDAVVQTLSELVGPARTGTPAATSAAAS